MDWARSDTLHAFELACHDARAASRRACAQTWSVRRWARFAFYHLDLVGGSAGRLALLLGDRAGEDYRAATDDVTDLPSFPEVSRADTLTVLVDGQRLLDAGARHNLRSEVLMMLQALYDGNALRVGQHLVVVLTKLDAVQGSAYRDRAQNDFSALSAQLRETFASIFAEIRECTVAASPKTGVVARGTGIADLVALWATPANEPPTMPAKAQAPARAFARLIAALDAEAADE